MQGTTPRRARAPYNQKYDPVTDKSIGSGGDYAPTYWIGTAGPAPRDDGPVTGDMDVAKLNREARKPPLFNKGFWLLF